MKNLTESEALQAALAVCRERRNKNGAITAIDYQMISFQYGVSKATLAAEFALALIMERNKRRYEL